MQYNIHGDNMPVVICSLDDGESMICEAGAMSWMTCIWRYGIGRCWPTAWAICCWHAAELIRLPTFRMRIFAGLWISIPRKR